MLTYFVALALLVVDQPDATVELADVLGSWRVASAECQKAADPLEQGILVKFERATMKWSKGRTEGEMPFKLNSTAPPCTIEWTDTDERGTSWVAKGIVRKNGGALELCIRVGLSDDPPATPRVFETDKADGSLKLYILSEAE